MPPPPSPPHARKCCPQVALLGEELQHIASLKQEIDLAKQSVRQQEATLELTRGVQAGLARDAGAEAQRLAQLLELQKHVPAASLAAAQPPPPPPSIL